MRPTSVPPSSAFVFLFLLFGILSDMAFAQNTNGNGATKPADNQPDQSPSTQQSSSPPATPSSTSTSSSSSSSSPTSSSTDSKAIPSITGGTQATGNPLTGLPTLSRAIPNYPAPSVPPTSNAPYMHRSNLPAGTVFIAVGAILGAFGLAILVWRGIVALLLQRSVERATMAQSTTDKKTAFPAPPAPFFKYTDEGSNMSVSGRGTRRAKHTPETSISHSNLFFSPTAANNTPVGSRGSTLLPSGFYAAGPVSPGANQTNSISLNNLRPDSQGHYTASSHITPTPPDTPQQSARRDLLSGMSTSSINLQAPPNGQRTPSAYLEDLLAENPGALPPPQFNPPNGSWSRSGSRTDSSSTRF